MDIYIVSTFWLLRVLLPWTWVYKDMFECLIPMPLDKHPKAGLLDHMFIFLRNNPTIFHTRCSILYFHKEYLMVPISQHPHQHLWFSVLFCFCNSHPGGYESTPPFSSAIFSWRLTSPWSTRRICIAWALVFLFSVAAKGLSWRPNSLRAVHYMRFIFSARLQIS